jgi:hypothetical protein
MVLIAVTVRDVMVLILITVRTVMFVWCSYILQPGQLGLCVFMLLQAGYLSLYGVCPVNSQDNYVCIVFLPVTARAVMSVWYSTGGMGM